MKRILCFPVLCVGGLVNAQIPLPQPVNTFYTPSGQKIYTFVGDDLRAFDKATLALDAGGNLVASPTRKLPLEAGRTVDVVAKYKPTAANVAGAVGRFAAKVSTPLVVGVALYDLAKELGFTATNPNGSLVIRKDTGGESCVTNCLQYSTRSYSNISTGFQNGMAAAVAKAVSMSNTEVPAGAPWTGTIVSTGPNGTWILKNVYNAQFQYGVTTQSTGPYDTTTSNSSSLQELQDAIAAKSGWPSSSAILRTIKDALDSGESIPAPAPTVSGPSSVQGPQTTSTTPAQNGQPSQTTNTNTVYNITYNNNTVTYAPVTTNTVNNGTTTTTTTQTKDAEPPPDTATDSDLAPLPTLYTPKYPNGLTGVWDDKKTQLMSTPLVQLTSNLQPTIAASSGYPTWPVPVVIGHWNFGTYDVSPPAMVWDFLKVCVIVSALFLARALIFGG